MPGSSEPTPRDVLAAEEFGMGTADPTLRVIPAHDVLAAEAFELGVGDPSLRRGPLQLPEEPYASAEAHDVLAAEEFAVPAGRAGGASRGCGGPGGASPGGVGASGSRRPLIAALGCAVAVLWRRRH